MWTSASGQVWQGRICFGFHFFLSWRLLFHPLYKDDQCWKLSELTLYLWLFLRQFSTLCFQLHNLGTQCKAGPLVQKLLGILRRLQQGIKRIWVLHNCSCHTFPKPPPDIPGRCPAHLCSTTAGKRGQVDLLGRFCSFRNFVFFYP